MNRRWRSRIGAGALVVCTLLGAACSSDDGANDSDETADAATEGDVGDQTDLADITEDVDLILPRDYLEGEWCTSDGETWVFDDDTVRIDDGAGGSAEFPVATLLAAGSGIEVVSQADDNFVLAVPDEVTYSRGSC